MVHVLAVAAALVSTALTRCDARLEKRPCDVGVVFRLTRYDAAGCKADVRAIEVQANALRHRRHFLLGQASVSALRARVGTGDQRFYRIGKNAGVDVERTRVCVEHLSGICHAIPLPIPAVRDARTRSRLSNNWWHRQREEGAAAGMILRSEVPSQEAGVLARDRKPEAGAAF